MSKMNWSLDQALSTSGIEGDERNIIEKQIKQGWGATYILYSFFLLSSFAEREITSGRLDFSLY